MYYNTNYCINLCCPGRATILRSIEEDIQDIFSIPWCFGVFNQITHYIEYPPLTVFIDGYCLDLNDRRNDPQNRSGN